MNAQAIQSAEIMVRFANPPADGKPPNIRATDGATYGVKPADFGRFQPGGRYRIDYVEKQGRGKWQGRTFRDIVKCEPVQSPATGDARARARARAPSPSQRSVSGGEGVTASELEFVTRMLAAYVACCGVGKTAGELAERARMLRGVYREVWG
jgi:hypothetical protein